MLSPPGTIPRFLFQVSQTPTGFGSSAEAAHFEQSTTGTDTHLLWNKFIKIWKLYFRNKSIITKVATDSHTPARKILDMLKYAAFVFCFFFLGQVPRRLYLPSFEVILTCHSKGSGGACEDALLCEWGCLMLYTHPPEEVWPTLWAPAVLSWGDCHMWEGSHKGSWDFPDSSAEYSRHWTEPCMEYLLFTEKGKSWHQVPGPWSIKMDRRTWREEESMRRTG